MTEKNSIWFFRETFRKSDWKYAVRAEIVKNTTGKNFHFFQIAKTCVTETDQIAAFPGNSDIYFF